VTNVRVGVIGAGSWGTAIAGLLADNGHDVVLWSFEPEVVSSIRETGINHRYLEGVTLPGPLRVTTDIAETVSGADVVVSVSPSQFVARVMAEAAPHLRGDALIVSASKGIETGTLRTMDQVLSDALSDSDPARLAVLSGPSFAAEVARRAPTAVVVASRSAAAAREAQELFQSRYFRVYTNTDVLGVGLGGALKNVVALGAGVTAGLGFGHNTIAAVIARGLAEITRLGLAMGAERSTFMGLAGLGDLVLTCTGPLSRNRTVGYRLGEGEPLQEILRDMAGVPEGVETVRAVMALAHRHDVEMPISEEVYAMVSEGRSPSTALENLMSREPKPEDWS
jgi:glycerol-3-phosphate dehydrogenase (NAD(P)+)